MDILEFSFQLRNFAYLIKTNFYIYFFGKYCFRPNNLKSSLPYYMQRVLYNAVIKLRPKKVIEFGPWQGCSTISLAQGLRDIGGDFLTCYDLTWNGVGQNGNKGTLSKAAVKFGVEKYIIMKQKDVFEWAENPDPFNLLCIDIHNTPERLSKIFIESKKVNELIDDGGIVLFEGGHTIAKGDTEIINRIKGCEILENRPPGMAIINRTNK